MTWKILDMFRSKEKQRLDEEVHAHRVELLQAVMKNDRRVIELRERMAGALRLREGHDETDR
jgi:hypothetical protein